MFNKFLFDKCNKTEYLNKNKYLYIYILNQYFYATYSHYIW